MPAFHSSLNKMAGLQWLFSPPRARAQAHTPCTQAHTHTPPTFTLALSPFLPHAHSLTHFHIHTHTCSVLLLVQRITCEKFSAACVTREEIPANVRALFCHAATSGRINGVQLFSNVIHFTGFGSQPDPPSVSCSPSLSLAWICPTFRNVTCLPSLFYVRGTARASPPFRRGVLWVRWHFGYSTPVP